MRFGPVLILGATVFLAAGCGGDSVGPGAGREPAAIGVEPERVELAALGDTIRLVAVPYDEKGRPLSKITALTWTVRDTAVAMVDGDGLVRARGNGSTIVSAIVGRRSGSATVVVRQVPATLDLGAPDRELVSGDTLRLAARVRDARGVEIANAAITWSVSDTLVARIDGNGLVTALRPGTARISAAAGTAGDTVELVVRTSTTVITGITPAVLRPGEEAEIRGSGFSPLLSQNVVRIDGVLATVRSANDSLLVVALPEWSSFACGPRREVQVIVDVGGERGTAFHPLATARSLDLSVGEDTFLTAAEARCLELPDPSGTYLVGVYNTSTAATSMSAFRLRGHGATGAAPAAAPVVPTFRAAGDEGTTDEATRHYLHLEEERRQYERLGPLPQSRVAASPGGVMTATPPAVGSVIEFRIRRQGGGNSCTQYHTIQTRVVYVGPKALVLEDTAAPLAGQMDAIYQAAAEEFEREMLPILEENYGDPFAMVQALGSDGRIRLVFSPIVNSDGLNGFVTSADQRDRAQCPSSSMAPTMYVRVATGTGSNTPEEWYRTMRGTLIHEAKHIVSHAERISRSAPHFEESWLEESTARLAEELWARSLFGYAQGGNVDYRTALYCEDPPGRPGCTGREPRTMHKHFSAFRDYLRNSATHSPLGRATDSDASFYGSGWSLVRWALDHSGRSEREILRALTEEKSLTGAANLEARTGKSFAEIIGYWSFANFLDDYPGVTTRPELQHPSWNLRDAFQGLHDTFPNSYTTPFPLSPRQVPFGAFSIDMEGVRGGGVDFTMIQGTMNMPQYLELQNQTGGAPATTLRLGVVRIQ